MRFQGFLASKIDLSKHLTPACIPEIYYIIPVIKKIKSSINTSKYPFLPGKCPGHLFDNQYRLIIRTRAWRETAVAVVDFRHNSASKTNTAVRGCGRYE